MAETSESTNHENESKITEKELSDIGTITLDKINLDDINLDEVRFDINKNRIEDAIYYSKLSGDLSGVYVLTMDSKKHINSLCDEFVIQIIDAINELKVLSDIKTLIVRSALAKYFCVGADLKERIKMTDNDVRKCVKRLRSVTMEIFDFPVPVIAAIDGYALGGGLEYALVCDFRICSTSANVGLTETKLGTIPGAGGTQLLPRTVPIHIAKEMIFTARILTGQEAQEYGFFSYCVEQNADFNAAFLRSLEMAREIVQSDLLALKMSKIAINKGRDVDLNTGLTIESLCEDIIMNTKDKTEPFDAII